MPGRKSPCENYQDRAAVQKLKEKEKRPRMPSTRRRRCAMKKDKAVHQKKSHRLPFAINPAKMICKENGTFSFSFDNFVTRQAIRDAWANRTIIPTKNFVFLIGK